MSFFAFLDRPRNCHNQTKPDMEPETTDKTPRKGSRNSVSLSTPAGSEAPSDIVKDRLDSWKEIAAFIDRTERTAMRWAKHHGMPVQKVPGGRVHASRADISGWLKHHSAELSQEPVGTSGESSRKHLIAVVAVVCSLAILAGAVMLTTRALRPADLPAQVKFSDTAITALDAQGNRLWSHDFGRGFAFPMLEFRTLGEFVRIGDFLHDGGREVLVVVPLALGQNPHDMGQTEVACFSARGKLLWSYFPREKFRFGDHELGGPWCPQDVLVSNLRGDHLIWVAFSHVDWGNSYIASLDPATGRARVRYVNTGTIRRVNEVQMLRSAYLLVGGFNNEQDGGIVSLIDERKLFAMSPQTPGTRHQCVNCPVGAPDYYFVLPRSELNRFMKINEDAVWGIDVMGTQITASMHELLHENPDVRTNYFFRTEPAIHPISVRYSSTYGMLHDDLQRARKLDHDLEMCPERLHPLPIRMWTPSAGWTEIKLPPRSFAE